MHRSLALRDEHASICKKATDQGFSGSLNRSLTSNVCVADCALLGLANTTSKSAVTTDSQATMNS